MDDTEVDRPIDAVWLVTTLGPPMGLSAENLVSSMQGRLSRSLEDAAEASRLLRFPAAKGFLIRLAHDNWLVIQIRHVQ